MAKYITLDNGDYGYAYKSYYIIKDKPEQKKSTFSILDQAKKRIFSALPDFREAEWKIEVMTATKEEQEEIENLFSREVYEINGEVLKIISDYPDGRYPKDVKKRLKLLLAIRDRKAEGKELDIHVG